jgi:hypothetical protein
MKLVTGTDDTKKLVSIQKQFSVSDYIYMYIYFYFDTATTSCLLFDLIKT